MKVFLTILAILLLLCGLVKVWHGDPWEYPDRKMPKRSTRIATFFAVLAIAYGVYANSPLISFAGLFTLVVIVVVSKK
jgi:hypothetical protein